MPGTASRPRRQKLMLAGAAAGGALAVVGVAGLVDLTSGSATAATPAPTAAASPNANSDQNAAHKHRIRALTRAVHGEFTVKTKDGYRQMAEQRGDVTAVSPTSITLKSPDGFTQTYVVNGGTKVHKGRNTAAIGDVKANQPAVVLATINGNMRTASQILVRNK